VTSQLTPTPGDSIGKRYCRLNKNPSRHISKSSGTMLMMHNY